jgi:hypothetical protein
MSRYFKGETLMSDLFSTTSLRTAFSFPFQSKDWVGRFLIGVALLFASMFIPIIPALFAYGYAVDVMRQAINGNVPVLPEWKNWGQLGLDGLRSLAVGAVYLGPGFLVMIGGWVLYMIMYFGAFAMIASTPSHQEPSGVGIALMMGAMGVLFFSMFVSWLLIILGGIPLPAALAHFVARERLGAAFHVREWSAIIGADKWGFFIAWVVTMGLVGLVYFAMMMVYFTIIFCFLIYFIAVPVGLYLMLVSAVVFGQFYREGAARLETEVGDQVDNQA